MGFNDQVSSEDEDELTPFKKLVAGRRGSSFEDTAHTGFVEEPTQFDRVVYDRAESDEPTQLQTMVGKYNEPTQFQEVGQVSKKGGKGNAWVNPHFDVKHVQPIPVISKPKPRPLKQAQSHALAPTHGKAASKAVPELNENDESDANDEPDTNDKPDMNDKPL